MPDPWHWVVEGELRTVAINNAVVVSVNPNLTAEQQRAALVDVASSINPAVKEHHEAILSATQKVAAQEAVEDALCMSRAAAGLDPITGAKLSAAKIKALTDAVAAAKPISIAPAGRK